jgi:hypothetical protein
LSPDFRKRLEARLERERRKRAIPPARAGISAALLLVAGVALFVLELGRRPSSDTAQLPPAAFPKPVANAGLPFVSFQDPRASVVNGNPYPYGTALVEPATITFQPATSGR